MTNNKRNLVFRKDEFSASSFLGTRLWRVRLFLLLALSSALSGAIHAQGVVIGIDRGLLAVNVATSAIGVGHFDVMLRQSMRQAWEDFGRRTHVSALWIGPDIAAVTQTDISEISIEDLGRRIVAGANLAGRELRLQVHRDEAGVLRSVRILPHTP